MRKRYSAGSTFGGSLANFRSAGRSRNRRSSPFSFQFESLEARCLLSASPSAPAADLLSAIQMLPQFKLRSQEGATPLASSAPVGLTPTQIRHAYGIDQIFFDGGIAGDGSGQTIAIIDAYHSPTIQNDLHAFDLAFGLPDPPTFKQVAQDGTTNFPSTDPAGAGAANGTWELETALDVEWAHAIAPGANILLVEGKSSGFNDLVQSAVNYARSQPGVVAISMSFSGTEFSGETTYDQYFTTPAAHGGVTFLAATGDTGQPSGYPAYSPNVVGVGGTTLSVDAAGNYLSESGWSGSGGGLSTVEGQPVYQLGVVTQSTTKRANPDVAFDASPNSGVAVYDSYDFGSTPWIQVGGTSFATPAWAGLIAIADQGRSLVGLSSLDSRTEALPLLSQLPVSDFHDISSGNNGFAAGAGYDLVTGRGTPKADLIVGGLIGSSISGTVFSDANNNGAQDNGETGLAGWTVFDDLNNDGVLTPAAQTTTAAVDVPIAIPDLKTITSSIAIAGLNSPITDVNVNLTLHHTFDSDLIITLISPAGTQITLTSKNGGSGDNFIGAVLDDQAATSISSGSAPFSASFRPVGSLAALNGENANGVWTLKVADVVRRDTGTLNGWSLQITTGADVAVVTAGDGSYKFNGLSTGVHHIREVPQTGFTETSPLLGVYDLNVAVGASFKAKDFGNFEPPPPPPPQIIIPPGDFSGDGKLGDDDIPAMLAALTDLSSYQATNSLSDAALLAIADVNGDGQITNADIQSLLDAVAAADAQAGSATVAAVQESSSISSAESVAPLANAPRITDTSSEIPSKLDPPAFSASGERNFGQPAAIAHHALSNAVEPDSRSDVSLQRLAEDSDWERVPTARRWKFAHSDESLVDLVIEFDSNIARLARAKTAFRLQ